MRALLFNSGLPKTFWPYAAHAATYIRNRTVIIRGGKTPYELWTHKNLNLSNIFAWGPECWVHLPKEKDKLNPRSVRGFLIGYTDAFHQYDVYLPDERKIVRAKGEPSASQLVSNDIAVVPAGILASWDAEMAP